MLLEEIQEGHRHPIVAASSAQLIAGSETTQESGEMFAWQNKGYKGWQQVALITCVR